MAKSGAIKRKSSHPYFKIGRRARRPCCGFFLQGSVTDTAIANSFVSLANIIIFAAGIIEYLPRSHDTELEAVESNPKNIINIVVRPLLWGYYYMSWGVELYMSQLLFKAAKRRNAKNCCRWLRVEMLFSLVFVVCTFVHVLVFNGFNLILKACFIAIALYKLYTFWVVYCFIAELDACCSWNQLFNQLPPDVIRDFVDSVANLPDRKELQIPVEQLKIEQEIGRGISATVYKALYIHEGQYGKTVTDTVALKRIRASGRETCRFKAELDELRIMCRVGYHPNIVNLIGACTGDIENLKLDIVLEYCPFNNLETYLTARPGLFQDQVDSSGGICSVKTKNSFACGQAMLGYTPVPGEYFYTKDLVRWALDIAKGMEFLRSKKVIHGDLAARNVLLSQDKVAKISDFGFSRTMYKGLYVYAKLEQIPWRWMAPETIRTGKFSPESDIWAYGVTLWEIFSLAEVPYADLEFEPESFLRIIETRLLPRTSRTPLTLYTKVMKRCWEVDPSDRIPWQDTVLELDEILKQFPAPRSASNAFAVPYLQARASTDWQESSEESEAGSRDDDLSCHEPTVTVSVINERRKISVISNTKENLNIVIRRTKGCGEDAFMSTGYSIVTPVQAVPGGEHLVDNESDNVYGDNVAVNRLDEGNGNVGAGDSYGLGGSEGDHVVVSGLEDCTCDSDLQVASAIDCTDCLNDLNTSIDSEATAGGHTDPVQFAPPSDYVIYTPDDVKPNRNGRCIPV